MTRREFHCTAFATATDWRWPPESDATGCRTEPNRGHGERRQRFARALLHRGLLQAEEPVTQLASEVHVLDDVQVVTQGEVLVHDLDPELGRVLRAVDGDRLSVEQDLAVVVAVDARNALDQSRLAGAVVADEGHDLAVPHLEVDRGERVHGAEALVEIADLEQRRRRGCGGRRGHSLGGV